MDHEKTALKVLQINEGPIGSAQLHESLFLPFTAPQDNLRGVLLLRVHEGVGRELISGTISVALAGGILKVHDVAICLLIAVLGDHIYPVYLDPRDQDTILAFKQIVRQESLFLGAIFDADQLPFRLYPLPSGGMFKMFANPPKNLKRWTPAQFARAVEAVKQAFDGDIEGLLASMYPKRSLAELRFGMNLQADSPLH